MVNHITMPDVTKKSYLDRDECQTCGGLSYADRWVAWASEEDPASAL